MKTAPLLALCIGPLLAVSGCYNRAEDLQQLITSNRSTEAYVVHRDCANHGAVYYGFRVDGREYRDKAPPGLLACGTTKLGDMVTVYYQPERPQTHSLVPPNEAYAQAKGWYVPELLWMIGVPVCVIAFSIISEVLRGRKRRHAG